MNQMNQMNSMNSKENNNYIRNNNPSLVQNTCVSFSEFKNIMAEVLSADQYLTLKLENHWQELVSADNENWVVKDLKRLEFSSLARNIIRDQLPTILKLEYNTEEEWFEQNNVHIPLERLQDPKVKH